jgi:C1A family cysteine protease
MFIKKSFLFLPFCLFFLYNCSEPPILTIEGSSADAVKEKSSINDILTKLKDAFAKAKVSPVQRPNIPQPTISQEDQFLFSGLEHAFPPKRLLEPEFDLSWKLPKPRNQGEQHSAVGWVLSYAKSFQAYGEQIATISSDNKYLFSPSFIYNQINTGRNENLDKGTYLLEGLKLLKESGVCLFSNMPYNEKDFITQPTNTQIEKAQEFKINNFYKIPFANANSNGIENILKNNKKPVILSLLVDQNFFSLGYDNSYIWEKTDGKFIENHVVLIAGIATEKNTNNKYFKIINSKGDISWGEKGYGYISYDILEKTIIEAYYIE